MVQIRPAADHCVAAALGDAEDVVHVGVGPRGRGADAAPRGPRQFHSRTARPAAPGRRDRSRSDHRSRRPDAPPPRVAHQCASSIGRVITPTTTTPSTSSATCVPQCRCPATRLNVPSMGSRIQRRAPSPWVPDSSLRIASWARAAREPVDQQAVDREVDVGHRRAVGLRLGADTGAALTQRRLVGHGREGPRGSARSAAVPPNTWRRLPVDAGEQPGEGVGGARETVDGWPSSSWRPFAAAESGKTRYATCSTSSASFGATAWSTSPNVPSRVSIVLRPVHQRVDDHVRGLLRRHRRGTRRRAWSGAIIGVRTSGMWMLVNVTPSPNVSVATTRLNASSAAFDATYAREPRRVGLHADRRDVDDVAEPPLGHVRQQAEDQPDRAEVVERHRALEVVEAVVAELDRPPDRPAGVVDEHVDAARGRRAAASPACRPTPPR